MAKPRWCDDQYIESDRIDAFVADIVATCKKHGLSISHEDGHGGFIVDALNQKLVDWFCAASVTKEAIGAPAGQRLVLDKSVIRERQIQTIKAIRAATGLGISEAKDAFDVGFLEAEESVLVDAKEKIDAAIGSSTACRIDR